MKQKECFSTIKGSDINEKTLTLPLCACNAFNKPLCHLLEFGTNRIGSSRLWLCSLLLWHFSQVFIKRHSNVKTSHKLCVKVDACQLCKWRKLREITSLLILNLWVWAGWQHTSQEWRRYYLMRCFELFFLLQWSKSMIPIDDYKLASTYIPNSHPYFFISIYEQTFF